MVFKKRLFLVKIINNNIYNIEKDAFGNALIINLE